MKKIFSLVLCLVFIFTFTVPAFATDVSYEMVEDVSMKYTIPTKYDSILKSQTGEYAMVCGDAIQPVGQMNLRLSDETAVDQFMTTDEIPKEVKEYVSTLVEMNQMDENADLAVTYFSPLLLNNNTYTNYGSYRGMSMRTDGVYVENISTGFHYKVDGSKAKAFADSVDRIVFIIGGVAAGAASKVISFSQTLLQIFEAATGQSVVTTSSSDFSQVELKYDDYRQWTYGLYGGTDWQLGYCSEKVNVKTIRIYQQFVVNGSGRQVLSSKPGDVVKSPHFDDPWETAYYSILSPLDEWICCEIGGITWNFAT